MLIISGAATASLTIAKVTSADIGGYRVIVTNLYGSITSSIASLLVTNPPTTNPPPACTPPPANIVAWWQAEGNTVDAVNGLYAPAVGNLGYTNGEVGLAFVFDGTTSYIPFPASSNLDIGSQGSGITIETWIKPSALAIANAAPLIEWDSPSTDGLQFWVGQNVYANIKDTAGNSHFIQNTIGILNTNNWQHVALTYDKTSGKAVLYFNGAVIATNNFGTITPQSTYGMNIGRRTGCTSRSLNDTYGGSMDELSLSTPAPSAKPKSRPSTTPAPPENAPQPPTRQWFALRRRPISPPGGKPRATLLIVSMASPPHPVGNLGYTNGEVGLCFLFDGSTSYIPFPASSNLDIGSQGSSNT